MLSRSPAGVSKVVVVIPAYNEERFIASVVLSAHDHADVVIVVDDGSTDRTADLAERAGAQVVRMAKNGGKGAALNAGFEAAQKHYPSVVVILDGDAQHDAADIPAVASPILAGKADVVIGSRFLNVRSRIPVWRQFGQKALNVATNAASGVTLTDTQSGFRAFSPNCVQILRFRSKGLAVESEMQFVFKKAGLRVAEVPITVQYLDGNKRNPVSHGLSVVDAILTLAARRRPLLFFGLVGMPLFGAGLWVGSAVLSIAERSHQTPIGMLVASSGLLLAGLLMVVTGVTLNTFDSLVGQIRDEIRCLKLEVAAEGDERT